MQQNRISNGKVVPFLFGVILALFPLIASAQSDNQDAVPLGADPVRADPSVAPDQDASAAPSGPILTCTVQALRIMAPEVSGARVICRVTGATGDTRFTVGAKRAADRGAGVASLMVDPLCSGDLINGGGECVGLIIDRASFTIGPLAFDATLEPSGTLLRSVMAPPPALAEPAPRMQFTPLPEP